MTLSKLCTIVCFSDSQQKICRQKVTKQSLVDEFFFTGESFKPTNFPDEYFLNGFRLIWTLFDFKLNAKTNFGLLYYFMTENPTKKSKEMQWLLRFFFGILLCCIVLFLSKTPRFTFRESVQQHNFEKATTQQSASASTRHPSWWRHTRKPSEVVWFDIIVNS